MAAQADIPAARRADAEARPALEIIDTRWGFAVRETRARAAADILGEIALKVIAGVCALGAAALWLLPGSQFSIEVVGMKLGLTVILAFVAFASFRFANRGFWGEVQVDAAAREVRLATRNAHGWATVHSIVPMTAIEEVLVRPGEEDPDTHVLCLRVAGEPTPLPVATGREADLAPVLARLARDLRMPRPATAT